MKKADFVSILATELGVSKEAAKETLKGLDRAILKAFNQIEVDDKVPVGNLDVKKKVRKGREGECKIPGREGVWKTEDKIIAKVEPKKAFDDGIEQ